jgi:hypothetical protein
VVEALADSRITYVRSETPVSMSANWRRALAATRGEWIMFIGDDDGLMPASLVESDQVIAAHRVRSIRHSYALYVWPCADATGEAHRLQVHLGRAVRVAQSRECLAEMVARPVSAPIPLPYHGWIHRSLYEEAARSGPVFQGKDPDTYAGILLAALAGDFVSQERPLSVIGISGTSNTYRFVIKGQTGDQNRDAGRDADERIARHVLVPNVPTVTASLIDGLLKIRDRLGGDAIPWWPTPLEIARHCAASVWRTDDEGRDQLGRIRDKLEDAGDRQAFAAAVAAAPPSGRPPRMACIDHGRAGQYLVLDTEPLGVRTIAGAATAAAAALAASAVLEPAVPTEPTEPTAPPTGHRSPSSNGPAAAPEAITGEDRHGGSWPPRPHLIQRLARAVRRTVRGL